MLCVVICNIGIFVFVLESADFDARLGGIRLVIHARLIKIFIVFFHFLMYEKICLFVRNLKLLISEVRLIFIVLKYPTF